MIEFLTPNLVQILFQIHFQITVIQLFYENTNVKIV